MFLDNQRRVNRGSKLAIAGLALLSLMALVVTAWILADFSREQQIVEELTRHLPASDLDDANELAGELRVQSRLSILLILNIVASAVALTMLVRAYNSSERSLRDVRVLATDILASIDQGIITTGLDGGVLSINPHGQELLGMTVNGAEMALKDLPPEHQALNEMCRHVLQSHGNVSDQDYTVNLHGHVRHLRAGCSLLRDHNRKHLGTVIHIRDVTGKTLMEQRLRRMERYMGLGSLAAGLQHEIKNPLSALSLHVQLLSEALEQDNPAPEIQEMLDVLNAETHRISSVLEGFRDFASVGELHRTEVDPAELISKLIRLVAPQAQQAGVQINTDLPVDETHSLFVDPVRIEQLLLNLVVNAMAAMPHGGVLNIGLTADEQNINLTVGDTGCGIPDDQRDKVFDPYFTTRSTGTGMGLALSEKFVRQHNGAIDFETSPAGTVFTVTLPRQEELLRSTSEELN